MRVNEIFYSLQGEGHFTGTPAIFIRLAGCNLRCDFCDTDHRAFRELSEEDIMQAIAPYPARHVVVTGGEPMLQLTPSLVERLHRAGKFVQVETNGTVPAADALAVDWYTCSPKFDFCPDAPLRLQSVDELKVVYCGQPMEPYDGIAAKVYSLQPCDCSDAARNAELLAAAIAYVEAHPRWTLSLQTHKLLHLR